VALFTDRDWFLVAVVFYGVSALYSMFLFRKGFSRDDRINYALLGMAFAFHTVAMFQRGFAYSRCPIAHNLFEATSFSMWTIAAACLVVGVWPRLRFLGAFAAPILLAIGVFALMPGLDTHSPRFEAGRVWLSVHVALFALAYGAFGLSSVAALMYLTQERDLKLHKLRAMLAHVPPIQRLEYVAGRLLIAGFVLLTLALGVSFVGVARGALANWASDPKIMWSVFVWVLYGMLILLRWRFAQGGRRFAWGAVASFIFVLLTFPLFNLLSPIHNP
jgi:HemX protein